jgi:hypothetical protein
MAAVGAVISTSNFFVGYNGAKCSVIGGVASGIGLGIGVSQDCMLQCELNPCTCEPDKCGTLPGNKCGLGCDPSECCPVTPPGGKPG